MFSRLGGFLSPFWCGEIGGYTFLVKATSGKNDVKWI